MSSTLSPHLPQAAPPGSRPEGETQNETNPMATTPLTSHTEPPVESTSNPHVTSTPPQLLDEAHYPTDAETQTRVGVDAPTFLFNSTPPRDASPRLFHSHNSTHPCCCHGRSTPPLSLAADLDLVRLPWTPCRSINHCEVSGLGGISCWDRW